MVSVKKKAVLLLGLSLIMAGQACPTRALELAFQRDHFWGLLAGYGFQHTSWAKEVGEEVELALFYPTLPLASLLVGQAAVCLRFQGVLGTRTNGGGGIFAGGGPAIRVHYRPNGSVSPYLHFGAGVLYTDIDLNRMGTRENFFEEAGTGLSLRLVRQVAISCEYRMMHVSNASLSDENIGLNSHIVLIGAWHPF